MERAVRFAWFLPVILAALVSVPAHAQDSQKQQQSRPSSNSPNYQGGEPLDLARSNLDRVAASAAQIKEVLLKDTGILVELKRYIAKEATDNGQIVDDSALADSAIFERLDRDVKFRSVATILVQHYGYLLPSINPDSDQGKENELVLMEAQFPT